ncbi:MAG: hypothetical protein ACREE1_11850 [Stellaceae bacterium]
MTDAGVANYGFGDGVTRRIIMVTLGLMLLPAIAAAGTAAQCGAPAEMHDGWKTAAPAAEGLDPRLICAIGPTLEKMKKADANGVVIVRHGVLVYEHYFTGGRALAGIASGRTAADHAA